MKNHLHFNRNLSPRNFSASFKGLQFFKNLTTFILLFTLIFMLLYSFKSIAAITFHDGFENGIAGGYGKWQYTQKTGSHSLTLAQQGARLGNYSLRVEVRPGDNPFNPGSGNERAECVQMTKADNSRIYETINSGTQYYAFSVKLDANWQSLGNTWSNFFQLHPPDNFGTNQLVALGVWNGQIKLTRRGGAVDNNSDPDNQLHQHGLSNGSLRVGKWIDFVVKVVWTTGNNGEITVWRRDEPTCFLGQCTPFEFVQVFNKTNITTLQYYGASPNTVHENYWKTGFYRQRNTTKTSVLYLDCMTRGTSYQEVVDRAFTEVAKADVARLGSFNQQPISNEFQVFPNPAIDNVNVSFSAEENERVQINIVDISGKEVLSQTNICVLGKNEVSIPVSIIPRGYYFAKINKASGILTKKICISN